MQNHTDVPTYRQAVLGGQLPVARGILLSDEDRIRREVIARLMCDLEVDLAAVAARHGRTPAMFADVLATLLGYARDGLIDFDGVHLRMKPQWRVAVRIVCAAFDGYLGAGGRHAVAV
ncbi:MAG TPA: hypothetical protein VGB91_12485 [Rhizomicrobium sp.]